jgi:hypothetical protein
MMLIIVTIESTTTGFDGSTLSMPKTISSQRNRKASLMTRTMRRWLFVAVPSTSDSSVMNEERLAKTLFLSVPSRRR